jgi:hypothetical protein
MGLFICIIQTLFTESDGLEGGSKFAVYVEICKLINFNQTFLSLKSIAFFTFPNVFYNFKHHT